MLLGVISDTHGLLRPEAIEALRGSAMIIHAGDVGKAAVLEQLRSISSVIAVRGNIDTEPWAATLPETAIVAAGAHKILVLHDLSQLALNPAEAGLAAVVFGHSHKPSMEKRAGVLYLNPGSAGPRRFRLPTTLARLAVSPARLEPELITLPVS
jgi:putative phosphoesterase